MYLQLYSNSLYEQALNARQGDTDLEAISLIAKDQLQFHYGNMSYGEFTTTPGCHVVSSPKTRFAAIPGAFWALAKIIAHLAQALFCLFSTTTDIRDVLQAHIFYVARDLEECFGRVISLFHPVLGTYYVEESLFQKKCYELYLTEAENQEILRIVNAVYEDRANTSQLLAERYFETGDLDQSLKEIKRIDHHTDRKMDLIIRIIERYFDNGDLDKSFETIPEIDDVGTREELIKKMTERYFTKGHVEDKYLSKIIRLCDGNVVWIEDLIIKIAQRHFDNGDLDKSLKVIQTYYDNDNERRFDERFKIIIGTPHDFIARQDLIIKIAQRCLEDGHLDKAFEAIKNIQSDFSFVYNFCLDLMMAYYAQNDEQKIISIVKYCVCMMLVKNLKIPGEGKPSDYLTKSRWKDAQKIFDKDSHTPDLIHFLKVAIQKYGVLGITPLLDAITKILIPAYWQETSVFGFNDQIPAHVNARKISFTQYHTLKRA